MKRMVMAIVVIGAVLTIAASAWAKWIPVTTSKVGRWIVSDKIGQVQGGCKTVLIGLIYKKPRLNQNPRGLVYAKKFVTRVCCRAGTYQISRIVLVNTQKKDFHSVKSSSPPRTPKPGTVVATIVKRVCAPGFGTTARPKVSPKAAAKTVAADIYKKNCKYCQNAGGIWLCCTCKTKSGQNKRSCLDPRKCKGRGISNCDGKLTCGACR